MKSSVDLMLLMAFRLFAHFAVSAMSIAGSSRNPWSMDILVLTCRNDSMNVAFSEQIARLGGFQMDDFHFNDPTCVFDRQNVGYYVQDITPRNSCGSKVTVNKTHVTYSNSVLSFNGNLSLPQPADRRIISIAYECTYRIDLGKTLDLSKNISYNRLLIPDAVGLRSVRVNMAAYEDNTYMALKKPGALLLNDTLHVGIAVRDDVDDVFTLMKKCWTSASRDSKSKMRKLFEKGYPSNGSDESNVIVNGMNGQVLWNTKVSNLVKEESAVREVWIHCKVSFCLKQNCERACPRRAKRRGLRKCERRTHIISYGPLVVSTGGVKERVDSDDQSNSNATLSQSEAHATARRSVACL